MEQIVNQSLPNRKEVMTSKIKTEKSLNLKTKKKKELFECDICLKKFSEAMFIRHKKKHQNGEIAMKSIKCNICGKRFAWSLALEEHLLNHPNYLKCYICDKSFFDKSELSNHKQTHAETKSKNSDKFKCDLCGITCIKIRRHKRKMHNVETLYSKRK